MTGEELDGILQEANIRVSEAAQIFNVSRPAIYAWFKGVVPTRRGAGKRVEILANLIHKATQEGKFPIQDVVGRERIHIIKTIIVETHQLDASGQIG